ncbi:hypothetical protein SAMN05216198_1240 [Halopseudomonas litoralis]|uniref:DUF2218 domain-containing protein n=1 Tax=Halopseudomonas litoralis TaxID=797277 RepID=A0A1H1PP32_9GAMM|nr:DUF2218 domain-containing protein [Halopseudomonas litoralis]SDS12817.1 hypothetical protein SAMN05216198_1240 [Halopseudomonas litoralis]
MIEFYGKADTASAALYMNKLCKHFAHKIDIQLDADQAQALFPYGQCLMQAGTTQLTFSCSAPELGGAAMMRFVLEDHLERFARRENLQIQWNADAPAAYQPDQTPS